MQIENDWSLILRLPIMISADYYTTDTGASAFQELTFMDEKMEAQRGDLNKVFHNWEGAEPRFTRESAFLITILTLEFVKSAL